jgi:hypothetical protein
MNVLGSLDIVYEQNHEHLRWLTNENIEDEFDGLKPLLLELFQ